MSEDGFRASGNPHAAVNSGNRVFPSFRICMLRRCLVNFVIGILLAQGWWREWDGGGEDWGYSVCVDGANNIIVAGNSYNPGTASVDGHIWKYDPAGVLLWDTPIPSPGDEWLENLDIDANNNIYVCMTDYSSVTHEMRVLKYTASGTFLWNYSFGPNSNAVYEMQDIWVDGDMVFAVGTEDDTSADTVTLVLHYLDTLGNLIRTVYWDGRGFFGADAFGYSVCVNLSGNPVVGGMRTDYPIPNYKAMLVEFSRTTGAEVRRVEFNPTGEQEIVEDIDVHPGGDLVCVVRVETTPKSSYIYRYTSTFSQVWQIGLSSGTTRLGLYGVKIGPADTILVSGLYQPNGQDADFWIRKYTSDGTLAWDTLIDHSSGYDDWAEDCYWDNTGLYTISAGGTVAGGTNENMLVYKLPIPPVATDEAGKPGQALSAAPNPFTAEITISGAEGPFMVYDSGGRLLFSTMEKTLGKGLAPGVYFIETGNGMIRAVKAR